VTTDVTARRSAINAIRKGRHERLRDEWPMHLWFNTLPLTSRPLIVHAFHCRWCQRETGTSFAQNALIEADRVVLYEGSPEVVWTPSNSGLRILGFDLRLKVIVTAKPAAMVSNCPHPAGDRRPRERHLRLLRPSAGWGRPHRSCGARLGDRARTGSAGCRGVAVRQRGGLA
jgi:Glutathione-dependent formaldehyde-activating enzyme